MAENEQTPIQFFRNLNSLPETQDGAIYVSDIETEALPTNMYVDIGNTRYLIKPSYKAGEIEELENSIDNRINFYFPSIDA